MSLRKDIAKLGWKQTLVILAVVAAMGLARPFLAEHQKTGDIERLHNTQSQGEWTEVRASVYRILSDDTQGDQHQRFLVNAEGFSVLVAHNIDLAPRVPIAVGDDVQIRGEYVWNEKGGVLHWTHHDPKNRHAGGWIKHQGKIFK